MADVALIRKKYTAICPSLDERARRMWAAVEARALGRGGVKAVLKATGISPTTLNRGMHDLESGDAPSVGYIRRAGGGRKSAKSLDPGLVTELEKLVEPVTRGDPESPLRWTCKSTRVLAAELRQRNHQVSHTLVAMLLRESGYSLQSNRKTREGSAHPDRDAQFLYINDRTQRQIGCSEPAISVDTKKKELIGDFKNSGREWRPRGKPEDVRVHDFIDPEKGKAIPYGVYDMARNVGWVSVGITHDTAMFAVATIRRWWNNLGKRTYPRARSLLITADSGGSNGSRVRLWKWELQTLADEIGVSIHVSHLPPGTSKWNKIEHRLFSFITQNWRGKPLLSHATIVNLIGATRTTNGLKVRCVLDRKAYPKKQQVSDAQMTSIRLYPAPFHGDWNYTIRPRK